MNYTAFLSALRDRRIIPWLILLVGLCILYVPSFYGLSRTLWATEAQGHGPIVLMIALWLIGRRWREIFAEGEDIRTCPILGWPILFICLLAYAVGRSQGIAFLEIGSFIGVLIGCFLLLRGFRQLKLVWFGLFFMFFMLPLPMDFVSAVTQPMKIAVSYATEILLYYAGYPVARSGVILHIAQYQLQVADACAGLQTLFTLESMGLLYLNIVRHSSALRNIILAILIIPISFCANVIRVSSLTLITYYFGDEVGQGFFHKFAGLVLYLSALLLIVGTDSFLRVLAEKRRLKEVADGH
jgi:exosortase B